VGGVLRLTLCALVWASVVVLLLSQARARRRGGETRGLDRAHGVEAVAVGLVALAIALAAGSRIPEREAMALCHSAILNADLDRVCETLTAYGKGNYRTSVHPLQCLLFQPPTLVIQAVTRLSDFRTSQVVSAVCLSLSAALLWLLFRLRSGNQGQPPISAGARHPTEDHRHRNRWLSLVTRWQAGALVGLYVVSFGFLFHASIPESAGIATPSVVLPYLLLVVFSGRDFSRREHLLYLAAGILALGVTTTNVVHPLGCALVRCLEGTPSRRVGLKRFGALSCQLLALGAGLAVVQARLYPGCNLWFLPQMVRGETLWCRHDPLTTAAAGHTVLQMFGYGVVGPQFAVTDHLFRTEGFHLPYITAAEFPPSRLSPVRIALLVWTGAILLVACYAIRREAVGRALFIGLGANLALHLFYGYDLLLYVGDWLPAQVALMGVGLHAALRRRPRLAWLAVGLPLLLANNVQTFSDLRGRIVTLGAAPEEAWRSVMDDGETID